MWLCGRLYWMVSMRNILQGGAEESVLDLTLSTLAEFSGGNFAVEFGRSLRGTLSDCQRSPAKCFASSTI